MAASIRSCQPRRRSNWPRCCASAGADVTVAWQNSGHELTQADVITAREWLAQRWG